MNEPNTYHEKNPPEQEAEESKQVYEQRITSEREAYDWDHDISEVCWGSD